MSAEHSDLSAADSPDALHDDVSQSVLKGAPSAAPPDPASRAASGDLETTEHPEPEASTHSHGDNEHPRSEEAAASQDES